MIESIKFWLAKEFVEFLIAFIIVGFIFLLVWWNKDETP